MLFRAFCHFVLTKTNVFYGILFFFTGLITLVIEVEPGVRDATPFVVMAFLGFLLIFFVKPEDCQPFRFFDRR